MTYLMEKHAALPQYIPGTHEEADGVIRLNTNESPFPPSPAVLQAISAASTGLNFYNDPDCTDFLRALARHLGVQPQNLMAGNGSDQVLQLAFYAFADQAHPIYLPDVTYSYYELFAAYYHIPIVRVPLMPDYTINSQDYMGTGGMTVFPNPNAPTGLALPADQVRAIARSNPGQVVLVDEAYVDFGAESILPLITECPNLLMVRTFSKSGSLAGLRLGYAAGSPELISELNRMRNGVDLYGVNRLAQAAGTAALGDWDYYADNCRRIMDNRREAETRLRALHFDVLPSLGNFVFARPQGISARELQTALHERGILVRLIDGERTRDRLRITIGTSEQMNALYNALNEILGGQR